MKKFLMLLLITICVASWAMAFAFGNDVHVRGYTRSDGTYVQPHHRTAPDHTVNNNYSTQGNTNPYTGTQGTQPRDNGFSGTSNNWGNQGTGFGGNLNSRNNF